MPDIDPERAKVLAQAAGELLTSVSATNTKLAQMLLAAHSAKRSGLPIEGAAGISQALTNAIEQFIDRMHGDTPDGSRR